MYMSYMARERVRATIELEYMYMSYMARERDRASVSCT